MFTTIEDMFSTLKKDLENDNTGRIRFTLSNYEITVKQKNVVGNLIEEWIENWLNEHDYDHIYNHSQSSPDFWMDVNDLKKGWLEIKAFNGSANFDIGNFMSYITDLTEKPWKLESKYLCINYQMDEANGIITIDNIWLKNVWEISSPSAKWAVKVQDKKNIIYNLRPNSWYSDRADYIPFKSLEHFLSALDYVIKKYPSTSARLGMTWKSKVQRAYKDYFGKEINIPFWQDIANEYNWVEQN